MAVIMVEVRPGKNRPLTVEEAFELGFGAGPGVHLENLPPNAAGIAWDDLVKRTDEGVLFPEIGNLRVVRDGKKKRSLAAV